MDVISTRTAPHYLWRSVCDGWPLVDTADLSVKEEQMPPGTAETPHSHNYAQQFFYVLEGVLTMEARGETRQIRPGQGVRVPPGVAHQASNTGADPVRFLVISAPSTNDDRTETDHPG